MNQREPEKNSESENDGDKNQVASDSSIAKLALAFIAMAAIMAYSYYYPYPSGERPSLTWFLIFWFPQDIFFFIFSAALIFIGYAKISQRLKKWRS